MPLTTYTSYADVRAVLGVSDDDIDDDTLALPTYDDMLRMEMDSLNVGLHPKFLEVALVQPTALTDAQSMFLRYFRLFCTYATARALASALPMFGPKSISDGKASMARFSDNPYKTTVAKVEADFARMSSLLASSYAALESTSTTVFSRPWFSAVGLDVDPVTNA